MADNFKEKFSAFGERLKFGGAEVSRKMSERMNNMGGKMKELFQAHSAADKFVEEATIDNSHSLDPDWGRFIEICDLVNGEKLSGSDVVKGIKKRLSVKDDTVQFLTLSLLETCVKNCEKMFSEVASEKILDEMVKIVDDRATPEPNREKALKMIEAWGEATEELRYLPVFEETYKALKARGVRFPGRDAESLAPIFTPPQSVPVHEGMSKMTLGEVVGVQGASIDPQHTKEVFDVARNSVELLSTVLTSSPQQEALKEELTTTLVEQCRQSQFNVQRIIERSSDNEALLFEALNVNDELQRALSKYEEISTSLVSQPNRPVDGTPLVARVIDDDDSAIGGHEDLVRNRASKAARPPPSSDPMAELDEMIFGKKDGEGGSQTKKENDLIVF